MDLRIPARTRYEIEAPGTLVSRRRVDDELQMVYDDSTVVTMTLCPDGTVSVAVTGDRVLGLDGTTGAIVVSTRPAVSRRRRETADAAAI